MDKPRCFAIRVRGVFAGTVITDNKDFNAEKALLVFTESIKLEQVAGGNYGLHNDSSNARRLFTPKDGTSFVVDVAESPIVIKV